MPVIGERKSTASMGKGYANDPIRGYTKQFLEAAKDIMNEGADIFTEPQKVLAYPSTRNALKRFFVENSYDATEFEKIDPDQAADLIQEAEDMAEAQFDNDVDAINEYAAMNGYNPVIGMTFPIHKNIMMNNVFDKGAIPKFVAKEPKFTISMEQRKLVTPKGEEIDFFTEQHKIYDAIESTAPFTEVVIDLPETEGKTNVLDKIGASDDDNLSIATYISGVYMTGVYMKTGDINPETGKPVETDGDQSFWLPVNLNFTPAYGEIDRTINQEVRVVGKDQAGNEKVYTDVVTGYTRKNNFYLNSAAGKVTKVKLNARIDTSSAMLPTCSVKWKAITDIVEIPTATPINVPISPEEVKDIGALYNVNQLSKILSLMKTALGEYKDTSIKRHLDRSFLTMPDTNKFSSTFDFAPRGSYALDHVTWRHTTFMDYLDSFVTAMIQVLNDPNMTVSIFGAPDIVRKISPQEYVYQTPSNIGPIEIDFVKTVTTSDKRVYQFIGTDKLRGNNNLILILCPRNTDRIVYRIYDYQMYVSNEIRNMQNYALPAIHAFERWKFVEYQPVQGRIGIKNPSGLTNITPNTDPIGETPTNDFRFIQPTE